MPPHAPSLITTISPNGTVNLGAFEQTMQCSNIPPMIILAISKKSDTYKNLIDNKECVIGLPEPNAAQQTFDAGARLPRGESELEYIKDINTINSLTVEPPRLVQCWFSAEGKLVWSKKSGDHQIVCIEIEIVHLKSTVWHDDKIKRRTSLPALYYATTGYFAELDHYREIQMSKSIKKAQIKSPNH
jgi:flavin reductase (DIM6/NTAB) family NADH-FMN oxidoreductase RutF